MPKKNRFSHKFGFERLISRKHEQFGRIDGNVEYKNEDDT